LWAKLIVYYSSLNYLDLSKNNYLCDIFFILLVCDSL
jgi:hypothetical protein